ncbi:MAG: filamentous hemagglutinin N-terminal domain-containing protein, partial [Comamonas sp.]|nr:filamentous hemagglutinin N-terminal domain-containing protein [Candidatus Comamonas equi]
MNHCYRLVRSADGQRTLPAPETARGHGKATGSKALASASVLLGVMVSSGVQAQAPPAHALPTGGQVTAGQAAIGQSGNQMTVTQGSDKAIIHWQGFDTGSQAGVQFVQPSSSAVALKRVVAGSASQIQGQLNANGQVWVVNPSGVVFGAGSQVNVGGLVASTMDTTDADFLSGKARFSRNGSTASVTNQGRITAADGGTVALLAAQVANEGVIRAQMGNVALAAGDAVTLSAGANGRLQVAVDPATVSTLVANRQLIVADGGQVLMTGSAASALAASVVNNSGTVQAHTLQNKEGRIVLLADMQHGTTTHSGLLDASAPQGGNGGFVETSAAKVVLPASAAVTTKAAQGPSGTWLIDPNDYTIAASGGDMTGAQLSSRLENTSITLQSTSGSQAGNGDIFVNDSVSWSANKLTLNAQRNIAINATMNGSGTAQLALEYGQGSTDGVINSTTASYTVASGAKVNLPQGNNFSTKLGSTGATQTYTVITELGAAGSTTGTDLQGIQGNLAGSYVMGADIDASATATWSHAHGTGFTPIGNNSNNSDTTRFTGQLLGLGHSINGLTIQVTTPSYLTETYAGLFGHTGTGARLQGLGLHNASIRASGGTYNYAGALVGENYGTITQSYATGNATAQGGFANYAGALVGRNDYGTITQSHA